MKGIEPDFYRKFSCIAERCAHSCCVGWEIDIDEKSLARYEKIPGSLGDELRKNIDRENASFVLTEGERCPFLLKSGLCRLIRELGEDSLCDICREHPRFYNLVGGREERGLGLCCEEAVRLLLAERSPLTLIEFDDGETAADGEDDWLLPYRNGVYAALREGAEAFGNRAEKLKKEMDLRFDRLSPAAWAEFYSGLERLDEAWTELLRRLADSDISFCIGEEYERLLEYFIYRHLASAEDEEDANLLLDFCFLSVGMISALDALEKNTQEHIRLYSSEIEYSDENIGKILDKLYTL